MIVIPRQRGEGVVIADDIIVTVLEVREDKVRLSIEMPRVGTVHPREVYEAIVSTKDHKEARPSQWRSLIGIAPDVLTGRSHEVGSPMTSVRAIGELGRVGSSWAAIPTRPSPTSLFV